jgi:hypothetical protein
MIDPSDPRIQHFVERGYRLAGHAYLTNGRLKFTFVATNPGDGQIVQGWSRGGTADDALNDLVKRGGMNTF